MTRSNVRVAIIGAGLGGIAAAVRLKRAGIDSFTVFEKAAGPGGVWWHNDYPGCEVDVNSHAYSYSFAPYRWSGTHAKRGELVEYVQHVIDRFALRSHFRFGTAVESAVWDEAETAYTVRTSDGAESRFEVVVSAVGTLSLPRLPDWPGLAGFAGPAFHTAEYDHAVDLSGKRVALVGTGSSACQIGPEIAPVVEHLYVYQREPGHVLPKRARTFDDDERHRLSSCPLRRRFERFKAFRWIYTTNDALRLNSEQNLRAERAFRRYITTAVPDDELRRTLTPGYPFGCKRPVYASGWYPMFGRPNVTLVPHAVAAVRNGHLVDSDGVHRPADVVILSTGFQAQDYLATLKIVGRDGVDLHDFWRDEPWALLGVTVPGFPNFFMLYGPNTNGGGSIITQHEIQAAELVRLVRRLRRRGPASFDTRHRLAAFVDRWVQAQIEVHMNAETAGCHNYFHAPSGKNVTQWPLSHTVYRVALRLLSRVAIGVRKAPAGPRTGPVGERSRQGATTGSPAEAP